jgi:hypothetical protein
MAITHCRRAMLRIRVTWGCEKRRTKGFVRGYGRWRESGDLPGLDEKAWWKQSAEKTTINGITDDGGDSTSIF